MKQIKEAHKRVGLNELLGNPDADIRVQYMRNHAKAMAEVVGSNPIPAANLFELEDIVLIPRVVTKIAHRAEVNTSMRFNGQIMKLPLISAPMPDVTGWKMAAELARLGGMGFIHRFQSIEDQCREWKMASFKAIETDGEFHEIGAAVGATGDYFERFIALYITGCKVFCVDTANGANEQTFKAIAALREYDSTIFVLSGNVGSPEAFSALEDAGADAIRVGIGTGRNCETYTETGIYSPLGSLLLAINNVRRRSLIVADGGIRKPAHFVKALALGSDAIMAGGIFAGCEESPGEVIVNDGQKYKIYRGAASYGVQAQAGKKPIYNEGRESLTPYTGEVEKIYRRYENGLRSAMSYFDARTLREFRENVTWGYLPHE